MERAFKTLVEKYKESIKIKEELIQQEVELQKQNLLHIEMKSNYLKELEVTAVLFRKKKLFRRWRRMYLNVSVAKASFEYSSFVEINEVPSIKSLLGYVHKQNDKASPIEPYSASPLMRTKQTKVLDKGYKSMVEDSFKENYQTENYRKSANMKF